MKLELDEDWKRWTHEEMEDIITYAAEDEALHGADYRDWMYSYFLYKANGDPRQAFRDMMSFAAQFFNKPWKTGRPKTDDEETKGRLLLIRNFLTSLEKRQKPTWGQFEKFCKPKKPHFKKTVFYKLLKTLQQD